MTVNFENCACFGVAGNFTGHLEQAGEARDFVNVRTLEENAPKALFPTYIPSSAAGITPEFLKTMPFSAEKIDFPAGEEKVQIEPECALLFEAEWEGDFVKNLKPVCFGASNDVSIRKEGAKKISLKKNWGKSSKGFAAKAIPVDSFDENGVLNNYRIASFMVRKNSVFAYGEDSAVRDYSYVYKKLTDWIIEKLNHQKDEGPAENIHQYLLEAGKPSKIFVSIGATRYTEFGKTNFLQNGDRSVVILYPEGKYSAEQIEELACGKTSPSDEVSVLSQLIVV